MAAGKANVYEMVTARIIAELEKGNIPWEKPWTGTQTGAFNRISKKPYSLINQMLLLHTGEYATFKQWADLGGHVRKGEKSEIVVFWKILEKEETDKDTGEKEIRKIPMLRYYNVFHISQVEGVKPLVKPFEEVKPIEEADRVIADYVKRENIDFEECASNQAYYSPSFDRVVVPMKQQYKNINEYYSTTFHEMTHSTGHKNRLNRLQTGAVAAFGSETYSKEELVAEIGSASLMNLLGIETPKTFRNSTAYIQSWLKVLRNDNKFIVSASSKAEKAVNYLTVKDFMRADRAGTDVTGCSRTSTGRMISEPLQLDILTIEQQHRRNTEQQENKCFSGAGSGSRYRDHSREGRVRKGLFISGWGYSCRKYSAFTGGRTEGQKRFILWLWDCLR